jgi:hypothetical protein
MVATRSLIALAAIFTSAGSARGQTNARKADMPIPMRTILGIEVSRDSLGSVQRKLGPSTLWHTGDAGESEMHRCYRMGTGPSAVTVRFSSGEMGGQGQEVEDIQVWRGMGPTKDAAKCAPLSNAAAVQTLGGLSLGMSRPEIERLLGRPTRVAAGTIEYTWETEQPLPANDPMYAEWNARRTECFGGKAPFSYVGARIHIVIGPRGATSMLISRGDNAMC